MIINAQKEIVVSLYKNPCSFEELKKRKFLVNYSEYGIDLIFTKVISKKWIFNKKGIYYAYRKIALSKKIKEFELKLIEDIEITKMTNEMYRNDNTQRISIEQYNKEIDEAIARIDNGEFYTQEEVEKKLIKAESRGFTDKNKNEILAISKRLIKNK